MMTLFFFRQARSGLASLLPLIVALIICLASLPVYAVQAVPGDAETTAASDNANVSASARKPPTTLKDNGANSNSYLLQLFSGLMVVLLSIIALAWLAKRFNRMQPAGDACLQIVGGISMGARERVVVVQAGETRLVLGVSPGRINMLHVLDDALPAATGEETATAETGINPTTGINNDGHNTFSQNLAAAIMRKKS